MADSGNIDLDTAMRAAAFEHVRGLTASGNTLRYGDIAEGFSFEGNRYHLVSKATGIFKPQRMPFLLSIRTVIPRPGRKVWYDDQHEAHRQIFEGDEGIDYAFRGSDPNNAYNRWLVEASEHRVPVIYFLGVSPTVYQVIFPVFIAACDTAKLKATVVFGNVERGSELALPEVDERRYALATVKRRLHQTTFREAVMSAYGRRCALSGLNVPVLLDAAHIVADRDELMGQPIVSNGLPLSKTHHAAFDMNLIGIDPDYGVHVSEGLRRERDGPMLEAIKGLHGGCIRLPGRKDDWPDRERLEVRFAEFRNSA